VLAIGSLISGVTAGIGALIGVFIAAGKEDNTVNLAKVCEYAEKEFTCEIINCVFSQA
jgi:hypothetical protein